jgi:hypothetical protein
MREYRGYSYGQHIKGTALADSGYKEFGIPTTRSPRPRAQEAHEAVELSAIRVAEEKADKPAHELPVRVSRGEKENECE